MNDWNWLDWAAIALVIIGALNWGLVGLGMLLDTDLNLVNLIFGFSPVLEAIIYLLVGIAGLYLIFFTVREGGHDMDHM